MSNLYLKVMRAASPLLFGAALILVPVTIAYSFVAFSAIGPFPRAESLLTPLTMALAVVGALATTAPLIFFAAAIWRADQWFALRARAEGEAP